jgi:hypothetical protein
MASSIFSFSRQLIPAQFRRGLAICCLGALLVAPLCAKEPTLTAVELYRDASGPAYVLISGVVFNGKIEVRNCGTATKIDKPAYGKMQKIILAAGMAIEYGKDGLTLTSDKTSTCVVASNLKLEKGGPETPAELAAQAK